MVLPLVLEHPFVPSSGTCSVPAGVPALKELLVCWEPDGSHTGDRVLCCSGSTGSQQ